MPPPRSFWRLRYVLEFRDSLVKYVLLVNLAATLFMVGIIWFVQVVHYPLFARVGSRGFILYSKAHSRLTTYVVGLPMLVGRGITGFLFGTTISCVGILRPSDPKRPFAPVLSNKDATVVNTSFREDPFSAAR